MTLPVHLETSITFVTPNVLKAVQTPSINEQSFASPSEHFILGNDPLAGNLQKLALKEMALVKLPVGDPSNFELVEFYWIDVKKGKTAVQRLKKLVTLRWLDVVCAFEKAREGANGEMFTVHTNEAAADIESIVALRRFLTEGFDPEYLKKKKRSILLFHHTDDNAPRPD